MRVHTYLNFPGNAAEAFDLYQSVFGGEITSHVRFADMPIPGVEMPEEDKGKAMHIALKLGNDDLLMATDALESMGQKLEWGNNSYVFVQPDSREDADRIFGALSAGGEVEMPMEDQMWGDYYGALTDRFGIKWMVNYPTQQQG